MVHAIQFLPAQPGPVTFPWRPQRRSAPLFYSEDFHSRHRWANSRGNWSGKKSWSKSSLFLFSLTGIYRIANGYSSSSSSLLFLFLLFFPFPFQARVVGFQKRYDPEKYYVFIVSLLREKQAERTYLFRSHREFSELHQKLCLRFPLVSNRILSLSKGVYLGRSSVKAVAEKRRAELDQFLISLFQLAPEICHCDVIYTFFHPLLRDQDEEANVYVTKWRNKSSSQHSRNVANANGHVQGQSSSMPSPDRS